MLSPEAYSFQLKSRLAISLSWVAGYTNVVALAVAGHVISHMTGNSTMVANSLGLGRWADFRFYAFLIATFLSGAVASALMTEGARRRGLRSKYVLPIAVEAILLCCFTLAIDYNARVTPDTLTSQYLLCGLATAAMGLQNATITRISGSVVRTTHLTGIVTDLGVEGVQFVLWYWDHFRSNKKSRLSRALRLTRRHRIVSPGGSTWSYAVPAGWVPTPMRGGAPDTTGAARVNTLTEVQWRPDHEPTIGGFQLRLRAIDPVLSPLDQRIQRLALIRHARYPGFDLYRSTDDAIRFTYIDGHDHLRYNFWQWVPDPRASGNAGLEISVSGRKRDVKGLGALIRRAVAAARPAPEEGR